MDPRVSILESVWHGVASHLWQTTLVLVALYLLSRVLRSAPGRVVHALWWVGVAKLFLPLALLERWTAPLVARLSIGSESPTGARPALVEFVTVVLHPFSGSEGTTVESGGGAFAYLGLTLLWVLGMGLLLWHGNRSARQFGHRTVPLVEAPTELRTRLRRAISGTAIPETRVRVGAIETVPAVAGLLRPSILVPAQVVRSLDPLELRAILLHENCHRVRRDTLLGTVVRVALLIYFFYPPIWWLARQLRETSEFSCDEWVLEQGISSATYARALARALSLNLLPVRLPNAVGLGQISNLRTRLNRIDHPRRYRIMPRHRMTVAAAVLIVIGSAIPIVSSTDAKPDDATRTFIENRSQADVRPFPELDQLKGANTRVDFNFDDIALEQVFGAFGTVLHLRIYIDEELPVASHLELTGISAAEALERIGLEYNLAYSVEDSETLRVSAPAVAGMEGVSNPTFLQGSMVQPIYPEEARDNLVEGRVILQAIVRRDGSIGGLRVLRGAPDYPAFAASAIEAVRQWRYEPAEEDGQPVDVFFTIFIEFKLDGGKR